MATSVLTSFTMLHFPSAAQEETSRLTSYREYLTQGGAIDYPTRPPEYDRPFVRPNPVLHQEQPSGGTTSSTAQTGVAGIAPLQTFRISNDIFNQNVLGDSIEEARYRKPNAYEAEFADEAGEAAFAFTAGEAEFAASATLAVRVEEKVPYGQAWDFGLTQATRGSRTFTQHYDRPSIYADSVLINANCITAGEQGDLSRVIISFDAVFTRSVSLCEAGRTSGTSEYSRGYNSVNLDVPQGVTTLTVTQYVDKGNNGGTAITDGFVQWFGPGSQLAGANPTAPRSGANTVTTPPPAPVPTTGGIAPNPCRFEVAGAYERCISGWEYEQRQRRQNNQNNTSTSTPEPAPTTQPITEPQVPDLGNWCYQNPLISCVGIGPIGPIDYRPIFRSPFG